MRNTVLLGACITATAVAALQSAAPAVVVFQDNFENVAGVSPYPDAGADADPVAQIGSWTIIEAQPSRVQVSTEYAPAEGTRALVTERTGDGISELRANFSGAVPANPADLVTISFRYKDPTPDPQFSGTVDVFQVYGYNDTDTNYDQQLFDLRILKNWGDANDVYVGFGANGGSADPPSGARFENVGDPDDVWNLVVLELDFSANQYTMTINGASPVSGPGTIGFNGDAASADQIQQLMFYHLNSNLTRFALDDITVTAVPEPTAMTMLALGSSAALLGRRRNRW